MLVLAVMFVCALITVDADIVVIAETVSAAETLIVAPIVNVRFAGVAPRLIVRFRSAPNASVFIILIL